MLIPSGGLSSVHFIMKILAGWIAVVAASAMAGIAALAQETQTNYVIPLIVMNDVPLTQALKNLSRQANFNFILDPRVPGSTLGPGHRAKEPIISIRWKNVTACQAFDRMLAANRLVAVTNPLCVQIMPAHPGSRIIPDKLLAGDSKGISSGVFDDWDLAVSLRTLGKMAGIKLAFDPLLSAPAFGLHGEASVVWPTNKEPAMARQALMITLGNYGLAMVENSRTGAARISFDMHGETNLLRVAVAPRSKDGWRTVDEGFRMTIPPDWEKQKVWPFDSNCGSYQGDTADLDFDEVAMMYPAKDAEAAVKQMEEKESNPKLLGVGEEIWHLNGRIAGFFKVDPNVYSHPRFSNVVKLVVPYKSPPGYLSVTVFYKNEEDLPSVRRVLRSIEWKAAK
jgi:hypothetical protein